MRTPDWTQPVRRDVARRFVEAHPDRHVRCLTHMVGLDRTGPKLPNMYRNYSACNPGDEPYRELERLGLVKLDGRMGDYDYYSATDAGKAIALAWFWANRPTKKQRVYRLWRLLACECGWQETFLEFLTSDERDIRLAREEA